MTNKVSVLIVDDEVNIRLTLSKILTKKGYIVSTAENGLSAVESVKKEHFDVIIMDVRMPQMSGLEALIHIKQIRPTANIIFMSAFSVEDMIKDILKGGTYAMLKKPLNIDEVINLIEAIKKEKQL